MSISIPETLIRESAMASTSSLNASQDPFNDVTVPAPVDPCNLISQTLHYLIGGIFTTVINVIAAVDTSVNRTLR
jgi:hypothetical protein